MIDPERLVFEEYQHENGEHRQRHRLLDHLQLPDVEGTAVPAEANPVRRHLAAVLKQGNTPTE